MPTTGQLTDTLSGHIRPRPRAQLWTLPFGCPARGCQTRGTAGAPHAEPAVWLHHQAAGWEEAMSPTSAPPVRMLNARGPFCGK